MQFPQGLAGQTAAIALVGEGRVGKAVGDYPLPLIQRRPNGLNEMDAPRCDHEQRLGLRIPALRRPFHEQSADFLGALGATGLARADDRQSRMAQGIREQRGLARFSRAFAALERDEAAAGQRRPQTR